MEIKEFVQNFAEQFDETDTEEFKAEKSFKDIDEWSSLTSLSIIAMVDELYNTKLTGDDIRNSDSIMDIFNIVKAKME